MITVDINIEGYESLSSIISFMNPNSFRQTMINIVTEELNTFAIMLKQDPSIPEEYRNSLTVTVIPEMDTVVLLAFGRKRWRWKRFSSRLNWKIYVCTIHRYVGGELSPEYTGPDYLKERWKYYKPIFLNKVNNRIKEYIRNRGR